MKQVNCLILSGDGINCERETAKAFSLAGASTKIMHVNELVKNPIELKKYDILALPGGFSFGDELGSGTLLALKLTRGTKGELQNFVKEGKGVIGICNGFQALVKMGLLPFNDFSRTVSLAPNNHGSFIDRWVELEIPKSVRSKFLSGLTGKTLRMPVRHGEGRLVCSSEGVFQKISQNNLGAFYYKEDINGSIDMLAGISNENGNVLGLMPHPEAALYSVLDPKSNFNTNETTLNLMLFKNMVEYYKAFKVGS